MKLYYKRKKDFKTVRVGIEKYSDIEISESREDFARWTGTSRNWVIKLKKKQKRKE